MFEDTKEDIEQVLVRLEQEGNLHTQYKLYIEDGAPKLLGRGGFSSVYEVEDVSDNKKHLALKVIGLEGKNVTENYLKKSEKLQKFFQQKHSNIMQIYEIWDKELFLDDQGKWQVVPPDQESKNSMMVQFILMEKLEPILIRDKYKKTSLKRDELEVEDEVIVFAKHIGKAIAEAHKNNILHRDIKLENIFWDSKSQKYKLGDFGIAKYSENQYAQTKLFTQGYGAPEIQNHLVEQYNASADIYSFGITLYLLLNELRFPGSEGYFVNMIQYQEEFIFPAPLHASEQMTRMIRKMCSYHPQDRYQTVDEMLRDLEEFSNWKNENEVAEDIDDLETIYNAQDDLEDDRTQTYREERVDEVGDAVEEATDIRYHRIKMERQNQEDFLSSSRWRMLLTAFICAFMFQSFCPKPDFLLSWEFLVFPLAVFVEGILLKEKEFYLEFGIVTIFVLLFSIMKVGVNICYIVLFFALLTGLPTIISGCGFGVALWVVQMLTEKFWWADTLHKWDVGWIFLTLFLILFISSMWHSQIYNKVTTVSAYIGFWLMNFTGPVLAMIGVTWFIVEKMKLLEIPEEFQQFHLIRTGLIVELAWILYACFYIKIYEEINKDEYLDNERNS